jgi:hypothetical protein
LEIAAGKLGRCPAEAGPSASSGGRAVVAGPARPTAPAALAGGAVQRPADAGGGVRRRAADAGRDRPHGPLVRGKGREWSEQAFLPRFQPVAVTALLATLVLVFSFQADNVLNNPPHVGLIAVPILSGPTSTRRWPTGRCGCCG